MMSPTSPRPFYRALVPGLVLTFAAGLALSDDKPAPQGVNVGPGERGIDAIMVPARPITPEARMSDKHMKYSRGMVCVECHDIKFDVDGVTTATRQFINNFPRLSQEQIWEKIVTFLPGRERFAIASVANGRPTATTVDMVLDKDEKVLYVVSEVGTEKLLQFRKNPAISAVHFAGWTVAEGGAKEWRSVQVNGDAEIIPSSDPRFMPAVKKYNLVRVTPERAVRRFDLIRVTPQQIIYFDTTLGDEDSSVYQLWKRGRTGIIDE